MSELRQWPPVAFSGPCYGEVLAVRCHELRVQLGAQPKAALGVATALLDPQGRRLRDYDDPRTGRVSLVALAWEDTTHPDGARTLLAQLNDASDLETLASLWTGSTPPFVVMHRAQTSCAALAAAGVAAPTRLGCVTTAATLLAAGADGHRDDRPLDALVPELLKAQLPKSDGSEAQLALEADLLIPLMRELTSQMRQAKFTRVFQVEMQLLPAVIDMESAGMPVDAAALERVASAWVEEMGQDPPPKPKRRKRLEKLISTYRYWSRDYVDVDGRIRCRLNPLATDSGRFACSEPNLQQVPSQHTAPGMRDCFRASPGHRLVVADYAQIELRVAAALAPCDALRQVFIDGRDVHTTTAASLARKDPSEISARERQLAKAINFGFLFGMGSKRFLSYAKSAFGLELNESQALDARAAFFATFPGILAWHRRVGKMKPQAPRSVEFRTALGRAKRFDAETFSFNAALNLPIQGTAADGFKLAMTALHRELPKLGARGVLCVHDEFIAEVPEQNADQARVHIVRLMQEQMARVVKDVPIIAEATVASSWAQK